MKDIPRILILICLGAYALGAWSIPFRKLRIEEGLSHNHAQCILQDRQGFIWIGTTGGLNCYDGKRIKIFRNWDAGNLNPTASNNVTALLDADENELWIGTDRGLYLYNRTTGGIACFDQQTRYGVSISCEVRKLMKGQDGTIWIATQGQGFFSFDGKKLEQYVPGDSFANDLVLNEKGQVFVAMSRGEIVVMDKGGKRINDFSAGGNVHSLFYEHGKLWAGMERNRLKCLLENGSELDCYTLPNDYNAAVECINASADGSILAGTDRGLYIIDLRKKTAALLDNAAGNESRGTNTVTALMKDKEGGIWVTTDEGVNYIPAQAMQFDYCFPPSAEHEKAGPSKSIGPLCEDSEGNLYAGTKRGVYVRQPGKQKMYRLETSGSGPDIMDVSTLWMDKDRLWIGTYNEGIIRVDLKTKKSVRFYRQPSIPYSLLSNQVLDIYRDRSGILYIGTNEGLCRMDEAKGIFMQETVIGSTVQVEDIYEDSARNLWIATSNNGVYRCDRTTGRWKHYQYNRKEPDQLFSNNVTAILEDRNGNIWFGTNGDGIGQYHADTETFSRFDLDDKLFPSKVIYALEQDNNGNLWASTGMGLVRFHPQDPSVHQIFTANSGLQGNQFNRHSSLLLHDGKLAFGGTNGLNVFTPSCLHKNGYVPPVYVTGISFLYPTDKRKTKYENRDTRTCLPERITLPYENNSFTLNFIALSYENPEMNTYRYLMEGVNKEWTLASHSNSVLYMNLAPGTYKFCVAGANNDGIWSKNAATLTLVITPPWWLSTGAKIVYLMVLCMILAWMAWLWNRYVNKKYARRMEEADIAREKEAYNQKINFFVNLVHEIRTPLSLIRLPLDRIKESEQFTAEGTGMLAVIDKNVDYLLGVTNQLLDFQKMESGNGSMHLERCDINSLVKNILTQIEGTAQLKGIGFTYTLPLEPVQAVVDADKLAKILVNLLDNAVKYTHTQVRTAFFCTDTALVWHVDDDGDGITEENREKIFKAFFRVLESSSAPNGTGVGLAYARTLAERHGGNLTVESNEWGGARFVLSLPRNSINTKPEALESMYPDTTDPSPRQSVTENKDKEKKYTVMLVEDHAELLQITARSLGKWYHIRKAANGQEALNMLENAAPDVIVSDVMMPLVDGLQLCSRIKQDINTSHIPVILLTAKTTIEAKTEGLVSGADTYVEKPFAIQQLKAQIENLLRMRQRFHEQMADLEKGLAAIQTGNGTGMSQKDLEWTKRLYTLIDEQLSDEAFSIDSLAEALNMSRSNFYRKIKALSGMAPNDYLRVIRLNKAAGLLQDGTRVSEVYRRVGFSTSSYFAKCFKAQFGVLPKDFTGSRKE